MYAAAGSNSTNRVWSVVEIMKFPRSRHVPAVPAFCVGSVGKFLSMHRCTLCKVRYAARYAVVTVFGLLAGGLGTRLIDFEFRAGDDHSQPPSTGGVRWPKAGHGPRHGLKEPVREPCPSQWRHAAGLANQRGGATERPGTTIPTYTEMRSM
jgi:hypothetical protein